MGSSKHPHPLPEMLRRIEEAIRPYPAAAMFALAEEGFQSLFEQLVACILSIRTKDEVSLVRSRALFARARTPEEMLRLPEQEVDELIRPCTFHESKAKQILTIARTVQEQHGGIVPCEETVLLSFAGVGPKCANLALGIACGAAKISVDVHVWRVTNRWGYIQAATPEQALVQLEKKLPREHWIDLNRLVMPFGKHICTGVSPHCSTCPVREFCDQVGVTTHR